MRRDPITSYGDGVAVVTVASASTPVDAVAELAATARTATAGPVRIVVADSAGADRCTADIELVRLGEHLGRGAAVNRAVAGLDRSVGWVAVADPGVRWSPGALDVLLAEGAAHPRAGALGPKLCDPAGRQVFGGGAVPGLRDLLRRRPATRLPAGTVGWLPATCLLLRRAALDSVDGFDPRYPGAGDDIDLGDRLGRTGWLNRHVPTAEVTVRRVDGPGMLETEGAALRRFVYDRSPAPTRALVALAVRGPR